MSEVIRVFVEKRPGFDIEAQGKLSDLRDNLGMTGIKSLRLINRYDISGLSADEFKRARSIIFSEPNADIVTDEEFSIPSTAKVFATEFLPGQYDQRADSAAQCAALLTQGERPTVLSAQVYIIEGNISEAEFDKIKSYIINPVESREASLEKPETLEQAYDIPVDVARLNGFISWNDDEMSKFYSSMGFAMTLSDLLFCRDYFRDTEKRDPSVTELRVIDTYWSDHCRHTTFLTRLDNIEIEKSKLSKAIEDAFAKYLEARKDVYGEDTQRPVTLMDMACIGAKYLRKNGYVPDLDVSDEINACSIEVPVEIDGERQTWLVQFKNETHNHPTEIEPFGGAATCLGGAIRDPLSGRAYVYQAMRVTGAGDPTVPVADTIPGKLPQRKITRTAAAGYSSYGNQIGLATGQVTELYDTGYTAKRMEIGAVVGASPKENVFRGVPETGDIIVLLGGRTGRDGCGGATGSSKAHDNESLETCGAEVQKGNPPTERKIQRLFRNAEVAKLIKRCNDFGAGGVCVAIGELADGLSIRLDDVRKKYDGLDGTELAISESQERMAVVLDPADVDKFISAADKENLEAYPVAVVTDNARLCMDWRGDRIVDISREFLNTNGVTQHSDAKIVAPAEGNYRLEVPAVLKDMPVSEALVKNMSRLEVCSQKGLSERFDASIGAGTVIMPFAGKTQLSPEEAMVAKIPLEKGETDDATAMSYGYIPAHTRRSPFHGSAYAVVESLSKLAAVGADPATARLTFQEYFERLGTRSERWGKPAAALLGALDAQLEMKVPSIGGKDSMSGSFNELDVPPTLVSFALAMTKASRTVSAALQSVGSKLVFIPVPENEETLLPDWEKLKKVYSVIYDNCCKGNILSASVVKEGGTAASVVKMAFGNEIGVEFAGTPDMTALFAPISGSFVIETKDESIFSGIDYTVLGTTVADASITIGSEKIALADLRKAWEGTLEPIFPSYTKNEPVVENIPLYTQKSGLAPSIKAAKPRVFIPVFPGTNCEVDTARAFEKAGAQTEIFIVRNLTPSAIEESIDAMEKSIKNSQIIMIPGGFSGGDEPDGSGKFIATVFRNPKISAAVTELLENRDGLMLGICNGFQALIKLGLVPYGKIVDIKENDPTLTFNTLGRHVSRMVYTRVTSVKSPWFAGCEAGDIHAVPVSHGEGRFVADKETLERLIANGQIATQYVNPNGDPSASVEWNPNGSVCAIEGITSPDGRVLGKMGHSERKGNNLYKNVPGNKDQKIFESGVKYFK